MGHMTRVDGCIIPIRNEPLKGHGPEKPGPGIEVSLPVTIHSHQVLVIPAIPKRHGPGIVIVSVTNCNKVFPRHSLQGHVSIKNQDPAIVPGLFRSQLPESFSGL